MFIQPDKSHTNDMDISAAYLDSLIWHNMRTSPRLVAGLFGASGKVNQAFKPRSRHLSKQGQVQLI